MQTSLPQDILREVMDAFFAVAHWRRPRSPQKGIKGLEDLATCAFVCSAFYSAARPYIYRDVLIQSLNRCTQLFELILNNNRLKTYTQRMVICDVTYVTPISLLPPKSKSTDGTVQPARDLGWPSFIPLNHLLNSFINLDLLRMVDMRLGYLPLEEMIAAQYRLQNSDLISTSRRRFTVCTILI
jgi:hypothetical protein